MENARKAWYIMQKDLRSEKKYLVWSIVYAVYMAVMVGSAVRGQMEAPEFISPVTDGLFMLFIPMLGFYFSRRSFKYLSEDSYTQMLAYFRALPIPDRVIILYRLLQMFMAFIFNGIIFFGLMYWVAEPMRSGMSLAGYLAFSLTWIGYGLALSGPYMYFEFSNHGKAYFRATLILFAGAIVAAIVIKICGGNLLLYSVKTATRWKLLSPLMWVMFAAAAASLAAFTKLTLRTLRSRDLM
ncbi:hypothetical protein [Paenibacillus sp. USDA918EY]|uniref:hypothetical protein n=1 Tax=Paenibacillus sp. USDA918EY TaxID=2689575 RepID=UPI001358AC91|nr:hypothetical protein [Paenibacillus sp. USDA918EY]